MIANLEREHEVTVITQNVDNLHERAGSTNVIHLHGELAKVCSSKKRLDKHFVKEYPLTTPIRVGDDPGDGSQMRPYVVLFGEYVAGMDVARQVVRDADIFVVVGTSLTVHPAANLVRYPHGEIPKFVIDPNDIVECDDWGYELIQANATEGMEILLEKFKDL